MTKEDILETVEEESEICSIRIQKHSTIHDPYFDKNLDLNDILLLKSIYLTTTT